MASIIDENYCIFRGFHTSFKNVRSKTHNVYYKVISAQRHYFYQTTGLSLSDDQEKAIILLDEAMHKFYLGAFALEQLWGVSDYLQFPDRGLPELFDVNLTTWQNEIIFLLSALLDQSLFTWRSFLDYYLKYLLFYCSGKFIPTMSISEFKKVMERHTKNKDDERANKVYDYLRNNVLCVPFGGSGKGWGDYLKELRDKTTHQKLIRPVIVEKENTRGYVITWPTVNNQNYSELVQLNFENQAFEMICSLFPVLYNLEWVPGPYRPGIFSTAKQGSTSLSK